VEKYPLTCLLAYGGLRTSIITDNVQGAMIIMLMVLCTIAIGTTVKIDRSTIHSSGLVQPTQLSWQLLFIFFVAIFFNLLIIAVRITFFYFMPLQPCNAYGFIRHYGREHLRQKITVPFAEA